MQTVADGTPKHGGGPGIDDDARYLASTVDDQASDATAELVRRLAERARASRFRRYRDRSKG